MDIENLTKNQIVLLTLLISFVTSIATGIVTVTLMDQTPPAITQTIHQVVERTIETVTPEKQTAVAKKEVVVVKEENAVANVVDKNSKSVTRIYSKSDDASTFVSMGIFVDSKGILIAGSNNISDDVDYFVNADDKEFVLSLLGVDKSTGIAYFQVKNDEKAIFKKIFDTSVVDGMDSVKLGESVVALGGEDDNQVSVGIISGIIKDKKDTSDNATTTEETTKVGDDMVMSVIKTNIPSGDLVEGSPLFNIEGNIIGIMAGNSDFFTPVTISSDFISE